MTKQVVDVVPANGCRRRSAVLACVLRSECRSGQAELPSLTAAPPLCGLSASQWSLWPEAQTCSPSLPSSTHCSSSPWPYLVSLQLISMRSSDHVFSQSIGKPPLSAFSLLPLFPNLSSLLTVLCSEDEERLVRDLFRDYNKLIRPVQALNETVIVR